MMTFSPSWAATSDNARSADTTESTEALTLQIERHRQLQSVERAQAPRQSVPPDQPLGRCKVFLSDAVDLDAPGGDV